MTNNGAIAPLAPDDTAPPWRDHRAIAGSVVVDPAFVSNMGQAAFLCRLIYNAASDDRVPFMDGFAYRYRLSEARRAGLSDPVEPAKSESFLPVPTPFGLNPQLTRLRVLFPALARFPYSMQANAVAEACRARAAHVKACVVAKANGTKLPKLHRRRADDAWTVSTDDFMLLRIGTDHAQNPPKTRNVTATTKRNRARRIASKDRRETAWAAEKRRCGWNDAQLAAGLARRAERQRRDRTLQQALQVWTEDERKEKRVRRDSPKATLGERRMKFDVLGLGRVRIDLGMAIPVDAVQVRLTLVKPAWRGAKVECRLTLTVPERGRDHDPVATGKLLHEALKHLPEDATRLAAVEAVRAAGIVVRGEDLGIANPSCDDLGVTTPPVRWPVADVQAMKRAQDRLSWKDLCAKEGLKRKPAKKKTKVRPVDALAIAPTPKAKATKRKERPRRSQAAERERAMLTKLNHRAADRQKTRAHQDAARLMRDKPVLVATDPKRMVTPLIIKDGPAERRAKRLAGETTTPADLAVIVLSEKKKRKMRSNLLATRFGLRIDRVAILAERDGSIHCTPGHEGTSAGCPNCVRVRKKGLWERRHECPCGLSLPRDQASSIETLGRALLPFRASADPNGMIAEAIAERAEARAKVLAKRLKRVEAVRAAAVRRRAANEDGRGVPRQPGRSVSGPPTAVPKRIRGQGRNVRKNNGQPTEVLN